MMSAVVSSANLQLKRPEQTKRVIYVDIKTGEQVLIINKSSHSVSSVSRSSSVSSPCSTPVHSRPSSATSQQSTDSNSSSSSEKSRNLKGAISKYLCGVTSPTQVNE